jgi:predicted DNA-binding ribbon-helix-helix protein
MPKYNFRIDGRNSSVSLEPAFWEALTEIAGKLQVTPYNLVREIAIKERGNNVSAQVRVYVIEHFMKASPVIAKP